MTEPERWLSVEEIAAHLGVSKVVLITFFRLGLTSFGGPVAHLSYFHDEFVKKIYNMFRHTTNRQRIW